METSIGPSPEHAEMPSEICLVAGGCSEGADLRGRQAEGNQHRSEKRNATKSRKTTLAIVNSPRNNWWFEGVELAMKCLIPLTEQYRPRLFSLHFSTAIHDLGAKTALRNGVGYVLMNLGFKDVEIELCESPHAFPDLAERTSRAALLCQAETE